MGAIGIGSGYDPRPCGFRELEEIRDHVTKRLRPLSALPLGFGPGQPYPTRLSRSLSHTFGQGPLSRHRYCCGLGPPSVVPCVYGPRQNHPASYTEDPPFSTPLRHLNSEEAKEKLLTKSLLHRFGRDLAVEAVVHVKEMLEAIESLLHRFGRALAIEAVVDVKEILEAVEFYERVRKRLRRPLMLDLACGHGLVGVLFALMERSVDRVLLVDRFRPASHDKIMQAAATVAPWVTEKELLYA
eukprot:gene16512-22738_t